MTSRKVALFNLIGTEIANADKAAINEELEDGHHNGVVYGHVLANIEHAVCWYVESINTDLFATKGFDSSDVA